MANKVYNTSKKYPQRVNGEISAYDRKEPRFKAGYIGECKSMADNRTYSRRGNIIVTCSVRRSSPGGIRKKSRYPDEQSGGTFLISVEHV